MKHRVMIRRRDGVTQRYRVGRTLRRKEIKKTIYGKDMICRNCEKELDVSEYDNNGLQCNQCRIKGRNRTRRMSRKITPDRVKELLKMDSKPSFIAKGSGVDRVWIPDPDTDRAKELVEQGLLGNGKITGFFEEPDDSEVVHMVGKKDGELIEEVIDTSSPEHETKRKKFIEDTEKDWD
jgi:hypothetical protein